MMNNILVVDDEAIQRRVLASMIRRALPASQVWEANNGKAALELMHSQPMDVVFTDIRMPIMDGLDFIEKLKQSFTGVKIIILSGFRYFEYAQRAIQLGAYDYLLKPIKEESITEILARVRESIDRERARQLENERIKRQLTSTMSVYYDQLLRDWVTHGIGGAKFQEMKEHFSLRARGTVLVSRLIGEELLIGQEDSASRVSSMMISRMESCLQQVGLSVSFFKKDKSHMITVLTYDGPGPALESLTELAHRFREQMLAQQGIVLTIGIGGPCGELSGRGRDSYREAVEAASFRYFLTADSVIPYSAVAGRIRSMHYDLLKEEEALKEAIRMMKSDLITATLDKLFSRLLEGGFPYPDQWLKSFLRMVYGIATVIKDLMEERKYKQLLSETESSLSRCADVLEFKDRLTAILLEFMNILRSNRSNLHESMIEKCIAYIDSHYMEDLSLELVAGRFFFSPNYLSSFFKNHLGMTFSKYLSHIRLKKAVELLKSTDMKVYEIASRVGFKDDKYFFRVFRGRFGLTPDEYRRNLLVEGKARE
ncbi:response regulator [Paenibacillus elgii]